MLEENEKKRRKQESVIRFVRSLLDYTIGLVIISVGVFFFFRNKWDLEINERSRPNEWDKIFGIIFVAYGAWRIYRGYKKNYLR
jgi:amino acid transporter